MSWGQNLALFSFNIGGAARSSQKKKRHCVPRPLLFSSADLVSHLKHMPGSWHRGSWPEAVGQWESWDWAAAALGSFRPVTYLFSGLCSNLSLPHRSHVGHEKAVLSSTPITVRSPNERKARVSEAVFALLTSLCSSGHRWQHEIPQTFFSLMSLYKCS